ncbi:hypothetical protein [Chryseobacterium aureum]|uniref:hypothetical protein n=1 Tax=Chryseobacterium aureum TaxID=2497456 RepID=UPI000F892441|nr:hypothetical protein [Chryseobacterium aureum]
MDLSCFENDEKKSVFLLTLRMIISKNKKVTLRKGGYFLLFSCFLTLLNSCCKDEKLVAHKISNISFSLPSSFVVKKEPAEILRYVHKNKMAIIISDISEKNKELFLKVFKTIKINP